MGNEQLFLCTLVLASAKRGRPFTVQAADASYVMDGFLCLEARVDLARVRNGLITSAERQRLTSAAARLNKLPLYVEAEDDAW